MTRNNQAKNGVGMATADARVLFCRVEEEHEYLSIGNWFFDEGQWAQCAEAIGDGEKWCLYLSYATAKKPHSLEPETFDNIEACVARVAEYFEKPVVEVNPDEFPAPDAL